MQRLDHTMIYVLVAGHLHPHRPHRPRRLAAVDHPRRCSGGSCSWGRRRRPSSPSSPGRSRWPSRPPRGGWPCLLMWPLASALPWTALFMLGLGGVFYTVGMVFLVTNRPRLWPRVFSYHEVFHILVIAGLQPALRHGGPATWCTSPGLTRRGCGDGARGPEGEPGPQPLLVLRRRRLTSKATSPPTSVGPHPDLVVLRALERPPAPPRGPPPPPPRSSRGRGGAHQGQPPALQAHHHRAARGSGGRPRRGGGRAVDDRQQSWSVPGCSSWRDRWCRRAGGSAPVVLVGQAPPPGGPSSAAPPARRSALRRGAPPPRPPPRWPRSPPATARRTAGLASRRPMVPRPGALRRLKAASTSAQAAPPQASRPP